MLQRDRPRTNGYWDLVPALVLLLVTTGGIGSLTEGAEPQAVTAAAQAAPPAAKPADEKLDPAKLAFFEEKIRPVLIKQCYSCHSAEATKLGGKLRMDHRNGMRTGGESGPVFVAGKPNESLVIKALRYDGLEMPPDKPLPEGVIADFVKWVEMGAPDPREEHATSPVTADHPVATAEEKPDPRLWSFQPLTSPAAPAVQDAAWAVDPIDQFVLAKIEAAQLHPAADATPTALIRRLYFDLIGLPPTAEQIEAFQTDYQQHAAQRGRPAVERLVDELLASPHFGERWGRYWLDLAGYGDSNGNDGLSRNPTFPHAWRYRDYVIQALNEDTPYDRFLTEQIAGDLLPADSPAQRDRQLIATGFLAVSARTAKAMNENFEMDIVADQIDVVGTVVMGLSVACARCHDHKHDPIPTADYYALAGIFNSTDTLFGGAAFDKLSADNTALHKLEVAPKIPPPPADWQLDEQTKVEYDRTAAQSKKNYPLETPWAMGVRDAKKPADCKINIKGESKQLGPVAPRGFLTACKVSDPPQVDGKQSGRLQLAQWLTRKDHPHTARVMANRVWLHLFGEGLVRTPDDFGVYGDEPSHPELLDHLANRFQAEGWSIKKLIRAIVLTRTYQLGSACEPALIAADGDNRWLARHNRRRLDAESLRDSMLAASGDLDRRPGQGSAVQYFDILVNKAGPLHKPDHHRSVYQCMLRTADHPELAAFDLPDFTKPIGQRSETTLPTQTLYLLNSPFVVAQAEHFSQKLLTVPDLDPAGRVKWVYRQALLREPASDELNRALALVNEVDQALTPEVPAAEQRSVRVWAVLCQALLTANEFRYID